MAVIHYGENKDSGRSLHSVLSAPPTASQASVPGAARETHDMLKWLNRWRANHAGNYST
jgi:hypothetical protein